MVAPAQKPQDESWPIEYYVILIWLVGACSLYFAFSTYLLYPFLPIGVGLMAFGWFLLVGFAVQGPRFLLFGVGLIVVFVAMALLLR